MNPKSIEIQSSPTTESATIPPDHPLLTVYRHLMEIPGETDNSLSAPSHRYALSAPSHTYALDAPTLTYALDAPTRGYALDAPTLTYALDAPTRGYLFDAPTLTYSLDAPTRGYLFDAPTLTYALEDPGRTYALDAHAMAAPTADVMDLPAAYVFVVDMPGVGSGELKVQVEDDDVLVITGEQKREEGTYLCMERRVGKLKKMFVLPENANAEAVSAVCKDGVLTVTVDKRPPQEPKKPKAIEVKIA